jgi:hypothetical protein
MEGRTPLGSVWIRLNREGKTTGLYTMFGSKTKHMPNEEWMQDLTGAQLRLEEIYELEVKAREWSESLRSKEKKS